MLQVGLLTLVVLLVAAPLWWYWRGSPRSTIRVGDCLVLVVAFSLDGGTLATGDSDGRVMLWDSVSGQRRASWVAHASWVNALAFSPDSNTLTTGSVRLEGGKSLWEWKRWDARTGEGLHVGDEDKAVQGFVAISPDGKTKAEQTNRKVKLYDGVSGQELLILEGHPDQLNCMAFSPHGRMLATGGGSTTGGGPHPLPWLNGDVRLWDVRTGELLVRYNRHSQPIMSVAFSPDGRTLASASYDGTVKLWDISQLANRE